MKKTETKSTVLLQHHLKALKLPTVQRECEKVAARCATENVDHLAFLLQLCELELIDRERRASERRLKAAKFPTYKTLDTFDFKAQPSLKKVLITELILGEYIDKRENILLVGGHRRAALVAEQGKLTLPSHWQSLPVAEADAFASIESRNSSRSCWKPAKNECCCD